MERVDTVYGSLPSSIVLLVGWSVGRAGTRSLYW